MTVKSFPLAFFLLILTTVNVTAQDVGAFNQSAQAEERFQKFQKGLPAKYQQENQQILMSETVAACEKLYADNQSLALTNPVCNDIFMKIKHPNMVSVEEFNHLALKREYSEVSSADKKVLQREGLIDLLDK